MFPCSVTELYDWHRRPGALKRLIPPWEDTTVLARSGGIDPDGRVTIRMHAGPLPYLWRAQHIENRPYKYFRDIQANGPFRR